MGLVTGRDDEYVGFGALSMAPTRWETPPEGTVISTPGLTAAAFRTAPVDSRESSPLPAGMTAAVTGLRWDRPRTPGGHLPPDNWSRQDALDNEDLAKILDERQRRHDKAGGRLVGIGSRVRMRDHETSEILEFDIVDAGTMARNSAGVSDESPLGGAVLDHRVGETVRSARHAACACGRFSRSLHPNSAIPTELTAAARMRLRGEGPSLTGALRMQHFCNSDMSEWAQGIQQARVQVVRSRVRLLVGRPGRNGPCSAPHASTSSASQIGPDASRANGSGKSCRRT